MVVSADYHRLLVIEMFIPYEKLMPPYSTVPG